MILGRSFIMPISELLKLEYLEDNLYNESELEAFNFYNSLDTWGMTFKCMENVKERQLVHEEHFDSRSRDLNVITYEGIPFMIYQYLGRGDVQGEVIFNKEVYLKLIHDFITEYLTNPDSKFNTYTSDYIYTVSNYDYGRFVLDDNKLKSVCKTTLENA